MLRLAIKIGSVRTIIINRTCDRLFDGVDIVFTPELTNNHLYMGSTSTFLQQNIDHVIQPKRAAWMRNQTALPWERRL